MFIERPGPTKGVQTRGRILDAVAELLHESSYEEMSIAEITRRANVTRPNFYFHFATKALAVTSLMEGLYDQLVAVGSVWYDHPPGAGPETFRIGLERTVELWRANAALMHAMTQAAALDPDANDLWYRWLDVFAQRALPTLQSDLDRLPASAHPHPEALARVLVGAVFEAMRRDVDRIRAGSGPDPDLVDAIAFLWNSAVYGSGEAAAHG